ncbi:uncharacterized protein [Paramisgurnus dabryanus]|uniref:uncharacterized protein n=1 Tax=Paramisgurnus dabryanus TaxID=90735 RepID=UPI0031F47103
MMRRRSVLIEVLYICFCLAYAKISVKTVLEGQPVMVPVLKTSALGIKDDQLFTFFKGNSTSNRDVLCAQYFCDNGKCHNDPSTVAQFIVQGDEIFLNIRNASITDSGQYRVSHNGVTIVCNFTLDVYKSEQMKNLIQTDNPESLTWLVPIIAVSAVCCTAGLIITAVIFCRCMWKKNVDPETKRSASEQELMVVKTEPKDSLLP